MISCRSRPGRSGIADVADVPAILVGDKSDVGAVVVPVVVPDIVEGDCHGYCLPSGRHRHCPGTAAAGLRRPSGGSSATTDRAAVVRRLGFGLSWTDFPKAGPHYLLWRWATWGRNHVYGCASDQGAERDLTAFLSSFSHFLIFWIFGIFDHQKFQHSPLWSKGR